MEEPDKANYGRLCKTFSCIQEWLGRDSDKCSDGDPQNEDERHSYPDAKETDACTSNKTKKLVRSFLRQKGYSGERVTSLISFLK